MPQDDLGSHFAMRDYRVLSMDTVGGPVTVHGVALDIKDVPWAGRQMWAPDAAEKDGKYYLYFPAKDKQDVFRIGVAVATTRRPVHGASRTRSRAPTASTPPCSRRRRQVLHVLRRHLGRTAAAMGDWELRRNGHVSRGTISRRSRRRSRA